MSVPDILMSTAASSQYSFTAEGVLPAVFSVLGFESDEYELCSDYCFKIDLHSLERVPAEPVLGRRASLVIAWDGEPVYVHGYVSRFQQTGRSAQKGYEYTVELRSPVWLLQQRYQSRVFLNQSIPQIIEEVCRGAGVDKLELTLNAEDYPVREYTLQHQQCDYGFLQFLLRHAGIYFCFEQDKDGCRVVFHDTVSKLPELPGSELLFQDLSGEVRGQETVYKLGQHSEATPGVTTVNDHNYRTPEVPLMAHAGEGDGLDYRWGEHYANVVEGEQLATRRQEANAWPRHTYAAESDCRGLCPGHRFTLVGHPERKLDGEYTVIRVRHEADQRAGQAYGGEPQRPGYRNHLVLLKGAMAYRPRPGPVVREIKGTVTAQIESAGSEYAHLDDLGRYRVRLAFDRSERGDGEASHPVRMMQPYGGRDHGFHFPLHHETEVVMNHINGDMDRPYIQGTLPNAEQPTPVTAQNPSENILRTWGGNELLMDDREGEERIELFTKDHKNRLELDATRDRHQVSLETKEGDMELKAGKSMLIESGGDQTVQVGANQRVTVQENQHLSTKNGKITQTASKNIEMSAELNVRFTANHENVEIDAQNDFLVDVKQNASMEVRNRNHETKVTNGSYELEARKDLIVKGEGGGKMILEQSGGHFQIDSAGDVHIQGSSKVRIKGKAIYVKGKLIREN